MNTVQFGGTLSSSPSTGSGNPYLVCVQCTGIQVALQGNVAAHGLSRSDGGHSPIQPNHIVLRVSQF